MKIFMGGGGEGPISRYLEKSFFSQIPYGAKVLYLPIADESGDFFENFCCLKSQLPKNKNIHLDMWVSLYGKNYFDVNQYSGIYISGGNTFLLAKVLYLSGFKKILKKFISSGKPVFGDSAGAIIFGSSTQTAEFGSYPDDNIVEWHYKGLAMFGNMAIHCHYHKREDSEIKEFSSEQNKSVLAIPENSAVEWGGDGKIRVHGKNGAFFFRGPAKIKLASQFLYDYSALYGSRLGKGIMLSGSSEDPLSPEAKAAGW